MALLTAITPVAAGTAWSPQAVSSSDTIAAADIGSKGCYLVVINGNASPDTVGLTDPSFAPTGNAGTNLTNSVANATTEVMYISPAYVNPSTNVATVTHTTTATVTCVVIRIPG
ncbi:MAG TPA: hypothetical protein VNC22_06490 [Sporichthya sp.]|jgi:hypothetical protein|nr:hypothetical protein [Kutzneria sp.]HVE25031.1 hypothetical protein [Sporichthya sp.]